MLGRQLQLVHYDDGSDANKANSFAKRLIDDDKVDSSSAAPPPGADGCPPCRWSSGPASPSSRWRAPWWIVEPVKKSSFKTHTDRMAAEKVFEDMKKRGITKVALLSETSGFRPVRQEGTEAAPASTASPWWPTRPTGRRTPT